MIESIVVALITGACAIVTSVVESRKTQTLLNYRMDQVEKKVGVHNGFEGRIIKLEDAVSNLQQDVCELKQDLRERKKA